MKDNPHKERRKHQRYDTELKIDFSVSFELQTKINFQLKDQLSGEKKSKVYSAIGHNINAEGVGFTSTVKLEKGEQLFLEVYLPAVTQPIRMEGRVRWSKQLDEDPARFRTGVKIFKVRDEEVEKSIFYDEINKVYWSILLEAVFGGFKESILNKKKLNELGNNTID